MICSAQCAHVDVSSTDRILPSLIQSYDGPFLLLRRECSIISKCDWGALSPDNGTSSDSTRRMQCGPWRGMRLVRHV